MCNVSVWDVQNTLIVRAATIEDAEAVAQILAEAFPALYQATFGKLDERTTADLLTALYQAGTLSLEATRLAAMSERVVGLAILHVGHSIGRGSLSAYWRVVRSRLGFWRGLRAFAGGLAANAALNGRIPKAADLVYVEALAVRAQERGRGVGTRLLTDAEEWARAQRRSRLALHVLATNIGARRLYERVGFRPWSQAARPLAALLPPRRSDWGAILLVRRFDTKQAENTTMDDAGS